MDESATPIKRRQKAHRRSNLLFVAACLLAFGLMLSSVTVALPMAAAQNASSGMPKEEGREPQDIPDAAAVVDDSTNKEMTKEEDKKFELVEATIQEIHQAIKAGDITCTELVQQYIDRAAAYNGVCSQLVTADGASIPPTTGVVRAGAPIEFPTETVPVSEVLPDFDQFIGLPVDFGRMEATISDPSVQQQFGQVVGIPDAGQVGALETINIRGERSVTCKGAYDAHPSTGPLPEGAPEVCEEFRQQPDALERAAELDEQYGSNPPLDELPMYCIPIAFKDPWDTKDMRSTSSADANYAMDAAPEDSTVVARLRAKGAIIYAKAASSEYHGGSGVPDGPATLAFSFFDPNFPFASRSTWAGQTCNPYDTERFPSASSSGSAVSVAANLVPVSICETSGGSCRGPAALNGVVSFVPQRTIASFGGVSPATQWIDRTGINARTLEDAALVLDALKDPQLGYFDPRDKYTAIPDALISEEPYANFVVDDGGNNTSLAGMRVGIVREHMVKHALNDVAISDQIDKEIKTILRDKLGAELVESVDPLYPNDPTIPNMEYTFQDAFAEILPLHMPEYLSKTNSTGALEFTIPECDLTTRECMAKASSGKVSWPDNLNLRRIASTPQDLSFSLAMTEYLLERGDARIYDWATLNDNSKYFSDYRRVGMENWESKVDIRSEGITEGLKMRYVLNLVVNKVMKENNLDVLVGPFNTLPQPKIGGPAEPFINDRAAFGFFSLHDIGGFPEIIVPAGFNQIVYEPQFALSEDKKSYISVTGTEQSMLPHPMPISILFWAGPGEEPTVLKVASAYEAATHHRSPPPDFGPLPTFPIEHMSNTTASAGYGVYAQKPARAEYVTNSSQLVGDELDSITLKMKSVGTINGTAEIGVLNEDLSIKKLFGTLDVTTLTPTYTDYEFKLTDELYTIESGDRIGIKYTGGGFDETSWVSVMLDLDPEDPFDGANSYLQYHYQGSWRQSPDRDIRMTLQQTHG